jgi:hypothetical protein
VLKFLCDFMKPLKNFNITTQKLLETPQTFCGYHTKVNDRISTQKNVECSGDDCSKSIRFQEVSAEDEGRSVDQ